MKAIFEPAQEPETVGMTLKILEQLIEKLDTGNRCIDQEYRLFFYLARPYILETQPASIHATLERIESERIDAGRHEAFHALLAGLEREYLWRRGYRICLLLPPTHRISSIGLPRWGPGGISWKILLSP